MTTIRASTKQKFRNDADRETRSDVVDEETPLLRPNDDSDDGLNSSPRKETPIPWGQYSLVLFLQLAEPLTSQVIYPFIPQLIREIGVTNGDDTKVGYYVGLMQSIFFATQALTVLHWSRASDHIGRKPIILTGLLGLALSMYCFGLSRTFPALVISRSLAGALNGNIGVIKSILGELTDETNVGRAFAYQPIAWSSGATIGPLIGGALSHPAERFPTLFGNNAFLKEYPYFLPCAIPATFSLLAWITTYLYLEETNPTNFSIRKFLRLEREGNVASTSEALTIKHLLPDSSPSTPTPSTSRTTSRSPSPPLTPSTLSTPTLSTPTPSPSPSLLSLLTPRVLLSAGNYALLSLIDISYRALQPTFMSTPTSLGGLGLPPSTIGLCFALLGLANGVVQVLFFARLLRWLGVKRLYVLGIWSAAPIFGLFGVMSVLVRRNGAVDGWVWAALGFQLVLTLALNTCYSCIFIFITHAAPSKRTLGATNGLAQMTVSLMRAFGPACASSLYSISLTLEFEQGKGPLAGALVYVVMLVFVGIGGACAMLLPGELWKRAED